MQKNKDASLNKRHEQDVRTNKRKERYFVVKSKNTHLGLFFWRGSTILKKRGFILSFLSADGPYLSRSSKLSSVKFVPESLSLPVLPVIVKLSCIVLYCIVEIIIVRTSG